MPAASSRSKLSPRLAAALLLLAAAIWGGILFRQLYRSPAQRHIEAGSDYAHQGDGLSAIREWQTAAQLEPNNAFAWQLLGQSYFEAQQWQPAAEAFQKVEHLRPDTPHLQSLLASSFQHLGDLDNALKYAGEALKRNPNDIPALEVSVAVHTRKSDAKEMVRDLRHLAELEPGKADRWVALAHVLIGQNNVVEALPVMDRLIQIVPDNAEFYSLRGVTRFHADGTAAGLKSAEDDLLRAYALRPNIYACNLYLGKIYRRRKEWKKAASFLEQATALNAKKADAFFNLADVYQQSKQPAKAALARQRFQQIAQMNERYVHLKNRADLNTNDFELQLQVALLALQREDELSSRYYLEKAARLRPNDARIQEAQSRLIAFRTKVSLEQSSAPNDSAVSTDSPRSGGP